MSSTKGLFAPGLLSCWLRQQITLAYVFFRAAYLKWQQTAPPRAAQVKEIAQQFKDRVNDSKLMTRQSKEYGLIGPWVKTLMPGSNEGLHNLKTDLCLWAWCPTPRDFQAGTTPIPPILPSPPAPATPPRPAAPRRFPATLPRTGETRRSRARVRVRSAGRYSA